MQAETNSTSGSTTRRSMWGSRVDAGTKRGCRQADVKRALAVQPIRCFYEERVSRIGIEELPEVTGDAAVPHRGLEVVPPLAPHHEQRRTRPILPAHHQVGVEELAVEVLEEPRPSRIDRKSTRLNASHEWISY